MEPVIKDDWMSVWWQMNRDCSSEKEDARNSKKTRFCPKTNSVLVSFLKILPLNNCKHLSTVICWRDGQISPTYLKSACPNCIKSVKKFRHLIFTFKIHSSVIFKFSTEIVVGQPLKTVLRPEFHRTIAVWNGYTFAKHCSLNALGLNKCNHSDYFYSASSSLLLLRGAPDSARILCRNFTPKRRKQLRVKDLSKVPT